MATFPDKDAVKVTCGWLYINGHKYGPASEERTYQAVYAWHVHGLRTVPYNMGGYTVPAEVVGGSVTAPNGDVLRTPK